MDLTRWEEIVSLAASPLATFVLAFFIWKMSGEIKELKKSIWENGFVHKSDLEAAWKLADEVHRRHEHEISRLENEIARLRDYDSR